MSEVGLKLAGCAIQVTMLGLLSYAACLASQRWKLGIGASLCAGTTLAVMGLTVICFVPWPSWFTPAMPEARSEITPVAVAPRPSSATAESTGGLDGTSRRVVTPDASAESVWSSFATALSNEMTQSRQLVHTSDRWHWPAILAVVCVIGFGIGMVQLVLGLWMVSIYRRRGRVIVDADLMELAETVRAEFGCQRDVELRESDRISTPATVGWRHPVILLPSQWRGWTPQQRHAVLAHEMAHISHHDFATCLLVHFCLALHYYHPCVHWLAARLRLEQELLADRAAAERLGGRWPYLKTLAEMALRHSDRSLGWPARCFLPTRGAFLRRITMLKDTHFERSPGSPSRRAQILIAGTLVMATAMLAAVRLPPPPVQAATPGGSTDTIDLSWIPRDATAVAVVRPASIAQRPEFAEIAELLGAMIQEQWGIPLAQIEQVTWYTSPFTRPGSPPEVGMFLRLTQPADFSRVLRLLRSPEERTIGGVSYVRCAETGYAYHQPDERTLLIDREPMLVLGLSDPARRTPAFARSDEWKRLATSQAAFFADMKTVRGQWTPLFQLRAPRPTPNISPAQWAVFAPLWEQSNFIMGGVDASGKLSMELMTTSDNAADAADVKETLVAMLTLGRNASREFRKQFSRSPDHNQPLMILALEFLEKLLQDAQVTGDAEVISVRSSGDLNAAQLGPLSLAVLQARKAAQETVGRNNLKQIALAMHNYHDKHKSFPPAIVIGPDGVTPHSWRVALLPFLDQAELYDEYRFTEPWDSPHNMELAKRVPDVYRSPAAPASGECNYFVMSHPSAIFSGSQRSAFVDIRDGTSNTVLVVEATRDIPWTKPDDIAWDPAATLPPLGLESGRGFQAALADGSVRLMGPEIDETMVKAMLTRSGGEVVRIDR